MSEAGFKLPPWYRGLPTADEDEESVENREVEYTNYDPAHFFVISGPLVARKSKENRLSWDANVPGRPFTAEEAAAWVHQTYGGWVEKVFSQGRWAYRVRKPTAPGGRYTPPARFVDRRRKDK